LSLVSDATPLTPSGIQFRCPEFVMRSFRYRTATLLGPWRATSEAAVADAIRSKQARREEHKAGWEWVVPGCIEEREVAPLAPDKDLQLTSGRRHGDSGGRD
jgi:hypothetical protein